MRQRNWLSTQPGLKVTLTEGATGVGELGALDAVTVLAGSGGVVAAVKILPEFLKARRAGLHIETIVHGQPFVLDATNVDEVLPGAVAR